MNFRKLSGFTMIETLVVIGLSAIIGVSVFSSFVTGLKVWRRASSPNFVARKVILGIEKFSRDLRGTYDYPNAGFVGESGIVGFVNIDKDKIWNVSYSYSSADKCIYRFRVPLNCTDEEAKDAKQEKIACGIENTVFSFASYNNATKSFDYLDIWNYSAQGIPVAVKTEITTKDERVFKKIITIPVGL